jgi:GH15 family glucan-1,4-alpha-glucosidase
MDRASKIADYLNKPNTASMWREVADEIHNDIMERGWKEGIGAFSQAYENDEYDSSVLLMEAYGFLPASHPKFIRTVDSIKENLMKDGLMYRYKDNDDFGEPESAFTISTFWLIRALYVTGREQEAKDMFDRILSYSNHLGLFSEDLDFKTKAQLGNFPQAYSHLAIINTIKLFARETERSRFIRP